MSPIVLFFFFSSRRRHTRFKCDWSSDVCSSDLKISAQHFDYLLQQFARDYNSKSNNISVNDPPLQSFILGRFSGFENAQILPWLSMPIQTVYPWIEGGFAEAEKNQELKSAHGEYIEKP